ncbi:hypothetical protein Vretifemale_19624, partial [Volvox reticuliferus]
RRGELGGVGEGIVDTRVGQVVRQVLQGALASDNGLHEEAEHGEHSQAAVLDLLDLQLSEGVGVVSQAQGVERATGVELVQTLTKGATVHTVTLNGAHQENLGAQNGKDGLSMHQRRVA